MLDYFVVDQRPALDATPTAVLEGPWAPHLGVAGALARQVHHKESLASSRVTPLPRGYQGAILSARARYLCPRIGIARVSLPALNYAVCGPAEKTRAKTFDAPNTPRTLLRIIVFCLCVCVVYFWSCVCVCVCVFSAMCR